MIKPKLTVDIKMTGTAVHHARTDIAIRDLSTIIDEPVVRGGTNVGPTPTEMLMTSLIGCTNVVSQRIEHRDGVHFGAMTIALHAKFDRRGAAMDEEIDLPFPVIMVTIDVHTDATPEQMDVIKTDLTRFCPVAKMMRAAGTVIEETWNVHPIEHPATA
jgi:uncharacterized OsmC-like protein